MKGILKNSNVESSGAGGWLIGPFAHAVMKNQFAGESNWLLVMARLRSPLYLE